MNIFSLLVLRCKDVEKTKKFYENEPLNLVFTQEQHGTGPIHYSTKMGIFVLELYPAIVSDNTRLGIKKEEAGINKVLIDPDGRKIELIYKEED